MEELTKEQKEAIENYAEQILVSASAGSGKTYTMMKKVGAMVSGKSDFKAKDGKKIVDVRNLLIVTFTKAVAKELKQKVIEQILNSIKEIGCNSEELKQQIENLPLSNISTIHAFCSNIIRQYFDKANVDPAYTLIEGIESQLLLRKAFENVILKKSIDDIENPNSNFETLIIKLESEDLFNCVNQAYSFIRNREDYKTYIQDGLDVYSGKFEDTKLGEDYLNELKNNLIYYTNNLASIAKEMQEKKENEEHINKILDWVNVFMKTSDFITVSQLHDNIEFFFSEKERLTKKQFPRCPKDKSPEEKELYSKARYYYVRALGLLWKDKDDNIKPYFPIDIEERLENDKELFSELMDIIRQLDAEYIRLKDDEMKLDFNDLEHKMIELLNNNEILEDLRSRFEYVFVDEYQDINPLQESILQKLSNGKNNIFMVGDIKQSIYGFRLSDPSIFKNKFETFEKEPAKGKSIIFNNNYRSRKEVLDFANTVFNNIMTKDVGGVDYKEKAQLIAGKQFKTKSATSNVKINLFKKNKNESGFDFPEDNIYSVKYHKNNKDKNIECEEGLYIAEQIKNIVGKVVLENGMPAKYSDIVILCRARSKDVQRIVDALLSQGIPVDAGNVLRSSKKEDIQLLISLLNIIDNPRQDVELSKIMLSVFGGFSLSDLAQIRKEKPSYSNFFAAVKGYQEDHKSDNDLIKLKIDKFYSMIDAYVNKSQNHSVSEILNDIVSQEYFSNYVLSKDGGELNLTQIRMFINSLKNKKYDVSISKFMSTFRDYDVIADTNNASQSKGDCVRTDTIHSSKGLEYPIVFLVDIGHTFNFDDNKNVIHKNKLYGMGIKHIDKKSMIDDKYSIVAKSLMKYQNREAVEEEMRLFYVALTRAKEYLFLSATYEKTEKEKFFYGNSEVKEPADAKSQLDWINYMASVDPGFVIKYIEKHESQEDVEVKKADRENIVNIDELKEDKDVTNELKDSMVDDYKYKESTKSEISLAVTKINKQQQSYLEAVGVVTYVKNININSSENVNNGYSGMKKDDGIAYHKVMELIDFENTYSIQDVIDQIEEMVKNKELTIDQKKAVKPEQILACVKNDIMKNVDKNTLREQQFKILVPAKEILDDSKIEDKIMLQGIIDMYIPKSEKNPYNILIDYKYTKHTNEEIKASYAKQIELYTLALEKITGEKVDKKYIYVLGEDRVVEF